jgi:cytochrome c biogenesis protein CcdA
MNSLSLGAIIAAALIDSINPCAFGVMVFLSTYLAAVGSKSRLLKVGLIYVFTVFLTYLLAGFGLLHFLSSFSTVTIWIYKIAGAILIVAGLINVKELFWYKKGISLQISEEKKPLIEKFIYKTSIPSAIILGFLVSAFELPCTGQVYLGILAILSKAAASAKMLGFVWLFIYNLIFVAPLIIILLLFYFDKKTNWFTNMKDSRKKWLRFFMGLGMLILGTLMLLGKL